jgi:hypothetical protein
MVVATLALGFLAPCVIAVEGDYSSTYEGVRKVRITKNGDVYTVRWDLADGSHWVGAGCSTRMATRSPLPAQCPRGRMSNM